MFVKFKVLVKKILAILYVVVVVVMAIATIVEKYQGTPFVAEHIYGAWWFSLLWAVLAALGTWWLLKRRVRHLTTIALHLSFLLILLGALLTHLFSTKGVIHLREGETTGTYTQEDMTVHPLPFQVRLDAFDIYYHEGTMAATDYCSRITILSDGQETYATVAMNRIVHHSGIRLYQSGYDDDLHGTVLALNSDPWGIPVTYTGYALLFLSLIWMLLDPYGSYRQLLRSPLLRKGALTFLCLISMSMASQAAPQTLSRETAAHFGRVNMLYNERICPVQTYAIDFTKKITGRRSWQGLTAEQVLAGFLFWPQEWASAPVIKVKNGPLKERLQFPDYCSLNAFFHPSMGGYILGPYVEEYYRGNQDAFHKDVAKMDDRLMLIMELRQGNNLKVFPVRADGHVVWKSAPIGKSDTDIDRLLEYQQQHGGSSIPSTLQLQAEYLYNKVSFATILFIVNLTMGFLTLGFIILSMRRDGCRLQRPGGQLSLAVYLLSATALTLCLALRWIITGHVPMANGYETMLLLAWFVMLLALAVFRRFSITLTFGFLLSGFFLLVSHLNQMDPQIGHLMPVLDSPLLAIHVSIIMIAFALLSMTFICGLTALTFHLFTFHSSHRQLPESNFIERLQLLSRLFLYPALTTLGLGIFIGAIWANISWGTYWSWDPKETWALITLMVYAVVVHTQSLPIFRRPIVYHAYVTLAFLTILMTYFGVNFFLGGLHSYA